ncbi:4-hydroxybenzoate polyprenyltransferase [Terriglobus roseus DSM 18391]|uniref:4-hydroxybenzoate polyprenyltransferase n=1 Tax=Terriglobus roseus (strain DSM 18391 / NRRL B-41598 / KBS 63) TaxID=926566 RepID=I3ZJN5_TERRK|nr:UbiA-like polyprenyltransferase [Terriglobus roseus]AFL89453.1 4-hydroxybenzoate polyprenyltransferase [Terriglobus roseus DSM 18391]
MAALLSNTLRSTRITLEMIKWEHSIFALPFALTGAVLAAGGWPRWRTLLLVVVCMISLRTAAMAFNRLADAEIDSINPRTATRAIPAGLLTKGFVGAFTLLSLAIFVAAAGALNHLTLLLSPLSIAVVLSYSYMKRITRWSHLVLGLALGIAPSAAWIAVRGSLDARIIVLSGAVLLWVAGFDVLYACQDFEHDRTHGLNSVPQAFGLQGAFLLARTMHLLMIGLLVWLVMLFHLGMIAYVGIGIVAMLLLYEHSLISPTDLRRMNAAFFTLNGVISVVFFCAIAVDVMLHRPGVDSAIGVLR